MFVAAIFSGRTPRGVPGLVAAVVAEPAGVPAGAAMLVAVLAVALVARANGRRGARGTVALLWVFLLVAGVALLPLAEPRLSARQLGQAMEAERARGARLAAWHLTEGSLGQFLFYSGGTADWIGKGEGGAQNPCVDCRLPAAPAEYLAGPGRRALLTTEEGFSLLPPEARSGRVLARGRVGGAGYVLLAGPARAGSGP